MMPPRPYNWPKPGEPMVEAARYVQALAEEHGLAEACRRIGVKLETLVHVAEKRALVSMMIHSGRVDELDRILAANVPVPVPTDELDRAAMIVFQACYMDGIAIGYQARVIEERATSTPGSDV